MIQCITNVLSTFFVPVTVKVLNLTKNKIVDLRLTWTITLQYNQCDIIMPRKVIKSKTMSQVIFQIL